MCLWTWPHSGNVEAVGPLSPRASEEGFRHGAGGTYESWEGISRVPRVFLRGLLLNNKVDHSVDFLVSCPATGSFALGTEVASDLKPSLELS